MVLRVEKLSGIRYAIVIDSGNGSINGPSLGSFPTELVTICVQDAANSLNLFASKPAIQKKLFVKKFDDMNLTKKPVRIYKNESIWFLCRSFN